MKKQAYAFGILTALVIGLAGCSSTEEPVAPITGQKPGVASTGPSTAPGPGVSAASPPSINVTPVRPGDGATSGGSTSSGAGLPSERSVFFEFDSNDVGEKYRPLLQAHAGFLSKNGNSRLTVQGNTDDRGSREYNLALGQRRAEAVKRMLVLMGARDGQVETVSFGEEKPRRNGKSESDYSENRRGDLTYPGQ